MQPISEIAKGLGIAEEDIEPYGRYKAKLSEQLYTKTRDNPDGKLILVTAINPTPAGEGKTTVSVGLGQALANLAMVGGMFAVVGVPLPFISYGGSAYLFLGSGIGVIQSVAYENKKQLRLAKQAEMQSEANNDKNTLQDESNN